MALSLMGVLVITSSALWWQGEALKTNWTIISQQKDQLAHLKKEGSDIQLNQCNERLCVKIDETAPTYQGGFYIIQGY
jgi:hypothetical protein